MASGIHKVCRGGQIARDEKTRPGIRQFGSQGTHSASSNTGKRRPKGYAQGTGSCECPVQKIPVMPSLAHGVLLQGRLPDAQSQHMHQRPISCNRMLSISNACAQNTSMLVAAGATVQTAQASAHREHCVMQLESGCRGSEVKKVALFRWW